MDVELGTDAISNLFDYSLLLGVLGTLLLGAIGYIIKKEKDHTKQITAKDKALSDLADQKSKEIAALNEKVLKLFMENVAVMGSLKTVIEVSNTNRAEDFRDLKALIRDIDTKGLLVELKSLQTYMHGKSGS